MESRRERKKEATSGKKQLVKFLVMSVIQICFLQNVLASDWQALFRRCFLDVVLLEIFCHPLYGFVLSGVAVEYFRFSRFGCDWSWMTTKIRIRIGLFLRIVMTKRRHTKSNRLVGLMLHISLKISRRESKSVNKIYLLTRLLKTRNPESSKIYKANLQTTQRKEG